jgi:hypothetical protein
MHRAVRLLSVLTAAAVALALVLVAPAAHADPSMNLKVDWFRVMGSAAKNFGLVRTGMESTTTSRQYGPLTDQASTAADGLALKPELIGTQRSSSLSLMQSYTSTPWFGVAPKMSLVARDWGGAKALVGGDIALTDALRTSRSYRMALARFRLSSGRLVPFAQVGLGEYRIDTDVMPTHVPDTELAALVGGGVEAHIYRAQHFGLDFAAETNFTQIVRDDREPQNVRTSRMWNSLIAMRMQF